MRTTLVSQAICTALFLHLALSLTTVPTKQVPPDVQRYANVRSVIDLSQSELIKAYPELKNRLEFTEDQSELIPLLQRVGENVESFFKYFPNTTSVEEVRQEVLSVDKKLLHSIRSKYMYLMLHLPEGEVGFEESRADLKGNPVEISGLKRGFLLTSGFASRAIYFHPQYQSGSRFRYIGRMYRPVYDSLIPDAHVIAFAQKPDEARNKGVFSIPGHTVQILVQGLAWINLDNYQIARMHTDLLAPTDIGLQSQTTDIEFRENRLGTPPGAFWLPHQVTIYLEFEHLIYRNRHQYSEYKLFSVETYEKVNPPKP